MSRKSGKATRRTIRRPGTHPKLHRDDTAGVVVLVTRSATGKGIHKRWEYSEPHSSIRRAKQCSKTHPLACELSLHVDGAFTDMFHRSLSSIGTNPKVEDYSRSTPPLESVASTESDDSMPRTPEQNSLAPRYMAPHPNESEREATMEELKKEQEVEDTFRIQWQKMLEQRKVAMRSIKRWVRKGSPKYDTSTSTSDDDTKDEDMKPDNKDTSTKEPKEGQREEYKVKLCKRPLGPCGTIIIEDPYERGERTSPPPSYPAEWVTRQLAGRESTESIESRS